MSKPRAPKKTPIPEILPLAEIADCIGEHERQIQRIADEGFIPKPEERGKYDFKAVLRGVVAYYKRKAAAVSDSAAADRARREKAEADSAELDLAEKLKMLCFKSDVALIWEDGKVSMRKAVQDSKRIPDKVKPDVMAIIERAALDEDSLKELNEGARDTSRK